MLLDNLNKTRDNINLQLKQRINNSEEYDKEKIFINKIITTNFTYRNIKMNNKFFIDCKYKNVRFIDCDLSKSKFMECIFENVSFENCNFYNGNENIVVFDNSRFSNCTFTKCNLKKAIFMNTSIFDNKYILSDMRNIIISMSYIESIYFKDCDCSSFKTVNTVIKKIEFEDNHITKFNEDTFIDKMEINKLDETSCENLFRVYKSLENKFEGNRLLNISREYYYLSKCAERKLLKGVNKIKSYVFWLLCGYGERPMYALITSLEILLFFTLIYMFSGLYVDGQVIKYSSNFILDLPIDNLFKDFFYSLYFSIVTFTAVGYGDITPMGLSIAFSGVEMILGVTMVGIWTATLARKITR